MGALDALMRTEHEERLWRSYIAMTQWRHDRFLGGKGFPTFEDSIKKPETRSAEEIKAKMLAKLRGEVDA